MGVLLHGEGLKSYDKVLACSLTICAIVALIYILGRALLYVTVSQMGKNDDRSISGTMKSTFQQHKH